MEWAPREYKYKVWNLDKKEMFFPPSPYESAVGPYFFTLDGRCYIEGYYQNLVTLQYLGIEDIDGNEICEGDILGDGDNYPCLVIWDKEESRYAAVEYGNEDGVRIHNILAYTCKWKILGNIYTTPELLEK